MTRTRSVPAALLAVALLLCAFPAATVAQGGPTAPQRAPETVIAPPDAAPVLDSGLVGAAPAPAPVVPDSGLVPADVDAQAGADAARPLGEPLPLGEPVPDPVPSSFLPIASVADRRDPVSALGAAWGLTGAAFRDEQLTHARVVDAQLDAKFDLKALFAERGLTYPPRDVYFRLFKQEQVLEVWVRETTTSEQYTLLREYPICAIPGRLGPKRRADDFQAPEGFYYIEGFNPESEFHLSLRLNYPNPADRVIGVTQALGGDIYIHGGCSTVGCFPMTDSAIAELYWLAVEARSAGQATIPVHVFPARLDDARMRWLRATFENDAPLLAFWENLREGYAWFETTREVPAVRVDRNGRYLFSDAAAPPPADDAPLGEPLGADASPPAPATEPPAPATEPPAPTTEPPAAEPVDDGLLGSEVAPDQVEVR
ncbi:MAG TPA: L,D-transpeptidase family protein [Longimicrobiales bacterium]